MTTKQKILNAARALFVQYGYAGTSMGKIAKLAGVNHSLLFHHFKNKANLWSEVKHDILGKANQKSKIIPSTSAPFTEFLMEIIQNSFNFYQDNPDISRMIQWQRMEQSPDHAIGAHKSPELEAWLQAFAHYQLQGDIPVAHSPAFIVTFILSVTSGAAIDRNAMIQNKNDQQQYQKFCFDMIHKALL